MVSNAEVLVDKRSTGELMDEGGVFIVTWKFLYTSRHTRDGLNDSEVRQLDGYTPDFGITCRASPIQSIQYGR